MKEKPSLLQKGVNLSQYTWELIKYIKDNPGKALTVSDTVYDQRIEICKGCQYFVADDFSCIECGCPLQRKARMILDACPIGKWSIDDSDWEERFVKIKEGIDNEIEQE